MLSLFSYSVLIKIRCEDISTAISLCSGDVHVISKITPILGDDYESEVKLGEMFVTLILLNLLQRSSRSVIKYTT